VEGAFVRGCRWLELCTVGIVDCSFWQLYACSFGACQWGEMPPLFSARHGVEGYPQVRGPECCRVWFWLMPCLLLVGKKKPYFLSENCFTYILCCPVPFLQDSLVPASIILNFWQMADVIPLSTCGFCLLNLFVICKHSETISACLKFLCLPSCNSDQPK
jgi:hypothetical protein